MSDSTPHTASHERPVHNKVVTKEDLRNQLEDMSKRVLNPREGMYGPGSQSWRISE